MEFTEEEKKYILSLREFLSTHVKRAKTQPSGYHVLDDEEQYLCGLIRDFTFMYDTKDTEEATFQKLLAPTSAKDSSEERPWLSDNFRDAYLGFIHTHVIKSEDDYFKQKQFEELIQGSFSYIYRDVWPPIKGDSVVMHRRVEPETLPIAPPEIVMHGNNDRPQIYYMPGLINYYTSQDQPGLLGHYNSVCHWIKSRGPADVYFVQPYPHSPKNNFWNDSVGCCDNMRGFIQRFMLPLIATKDGDGTWLPITDMERVKRNLSRQTLIGYCYGGQLHQEFENEIFKVMTDLNYDFDDILAAINCVGAVSVGYRPHPEYGESLLPTLNVCNLGDNRESQLHKPIEYDFTDFVNVNTHLGVKHGWSGSALHVESTPAPNERFWRNKDGSIASSRDKTQHDFRGYTQLNEREFRDGDYRDLYQAHPCAPLIRETVDALVEASKDGIRDSRSIIAAQREKHLSPAAIGESIRYVDHQQSGLREAGKGKPFP